MIDWFDFSLWLFALISGITLLILSGNKRYIFWINERTSMTEEKIKRMEKNGAIGFIVLAVLNLMRILKH
ncbi:MAG: hypothetical protein P4L49_15375 [Desulfosporosinus sp.]|nr:hypothetical protein [Desulfosporosinus sp.]